MSHSLPGLPPQRPFAGCRAQPLPRIAAGLAAALLLISCVDAERGQKSIERSVVRIENRAQRGDWYAPWNSRAPSYSSGSGFVIEGGRILTNAHVVSDARTILLHFDGDPTPHEARVEAIGHDCDLALVSPVEPGLLADYPFMRFGDLPEPGSSVETYGFPAGGQRISSTRGIVSRIEKSVYAHSGVDSHLTVQTDAAINPGNSGGPVVVDGRAAGVAFQASADLENVGYFIPSEVVAHFLEDVADGHYDGFPDLGIRVVNLENPAARRASKLRADQSGVRVDFVYPGSSADGFLNEGDVLLAIDGYPIANDGTIAIDGLRLDLGLIMDRRQAGELLPLEILRAGERELISVPMRVYPPFAAYRRLYDQLPRYFVYAGLVFVPLDRELLAALGDDLPEHLLYELYFRPIEEPLAARREPVVMLRRLDHAANSGMAWNRNLVVDRVNGRSIESLEELVEAIEAQTGRVQVFEFAYYGRLGVLDREASQAANAEILETYGVPRDRRL
jgi:S1-C subfamily serine protease